MVEVAVVGAGLAGLTCARQLHRAGYSVTVVEKSRGLGGRVATRRLQGTWADHGARYLSEQGFWSRQLIHRLCDRRLLHPWPTSLVEWDSSGTLRPVSTSSASYVASEGLTTIAKYLAEGLLVVRAQRVTAIAPAGSHWDLTLTPLDGGPDTLVTADALVLAIPTPQAVDLLAPLAGLIPDVFAQIQQVTFDPCLTAIATYPAIRQSDLSALTWQAIRFNHHPDLAWAALDSSKRPDAIQPVLVIQSSAQLAQSQLDATDLNPAGHNLLAHLAPFTFSWIIEPEVLQVHRWRYALANQYLNEPCLYTTAPLPLVCSGDWCGGNTLESALNSGMMAANRLNTLLDHVSLPESDAAFNAH